MKLLFRSAGLVAGWPASFLGSLLGRWLAGLKSGWPVGWLAGSGWPGCWVAGSGGLGGDCPARPTHTRAAHACTDHDGPTQSAQVGPPHTNPARPTPRHPAWPCPASPVPVNPNPKLGHTSSRQFSPCPVQPTQPGSSQFSPCRHDLSQLIGMECSRLYNKTIKGRTLNKIT